MRVARSSSPARRPALLRRSPLRLLSWRWLRTVLGVALAAYLIRLHLLLLWQRLTSETAVDPVAVLRWLATLLLAGGLLFCWRAHIPIWRGRNALVFWLLVLLLHTGAALPLAEDLASGLVLLGDAVWLFTLPAVVALVSIFVFGSALLALARERRDRLLPRWARPAGTAPSFASERGYARLISCLPPPVAPGV